MKFFFYTLGCKVNQYETEELKRFVTNLGFYIDDDPHAVDYIVINTCSVTQIADKKSRQAIRRFRTNNPDAKIIITGCFVENTNVVVPAIENSEIISKGNLKTRFSEWFGFPLSTVKTLFCSTRVRRNILVQNGCDYFCSYCIIPYVRKERISVSPDEVFLNIKQGIKEGIKEFVLTGINLGTYQYENLNLTDLLKKIVSIEGDFRIRLGSVEPNLVKKDLIQFIEHEKKITPHLHIPLQGTTDKILEKMNRNYTIKQYKDLVQDIKKRNIVITSDIIIGFPEEDEADFQQSISLIEEEWFMDIHLFPFSRRKGTLAYNMAGQITDAIKKQRMQQAIEVKNKVREKLLKSFLGKKITVLVEYEKNGYYYGFSEYYFETKFQNAYPLKEGVFVEKVYDGIENQVML